MLEAVSMMGGGLLRAEKYHTRKGCQDSCISAQDLIEGEFSSILASSLGFLPSLDHFIRSIQQRLRNGEAYLLSSFQIDH